MLTYTFIMQFRDGVYSSQVSGNDLRQSIISWVQNLSLSEIKHFSKKSQSELIDIFSLTGKLNTDAGLLGYEIYLFNSANNWQIEFDALPTSYSLADPDKALFENNITGRLARCPDYKENEEYVLTITISEEEIEEE